jgi:hypothetical protein
MRVFWGALVAGVVLVGIGLWRGFFDEFESKDWTTLAIASAALLATFYNLARNATPQPHWERIEGSYMDVDGPIFSWTQIGPGVAEQVVGSVREASSTHWTPWGYTYGDDGESLPGVVERGRGVTLRPMLPESSEGDWVVRLRWVSLPDTTRKHTKTWRVSVPDLRSMH